MSDRLLTVQDMNVRYGKVEAVYNISLNVDQGTIITVIGPNGKVVRFYPGNEWNVQDVIADLQEMAVSSS